MLPARIASAVIFYVLFFLGLFNPAFGWALPFLLGLACACGVYEFIHFGTPRTIWRYTLLGIVAGLLMLADAYYFQLEHGLVLLGLLTVLSLGMGTLIGDPDYEQAAARCVIGTAYVSLPLALIIFIWRKAVMADDANGQHYLIFLVLVTQASDIGAYFVGRAIGKHKLAPKLSPGKTIEGFVGGIGFTLLLAAGMKLCWNNMDRIFNWYEIIALSILFSVIGPIGDLTESRMKRVAGAKDSGRTYTGHGGVLDIIDSLLFTTIFYYVFLWIFHHNLI